MTRSTSLTLLALAFAGVFAPWWLQLLLTLACLWILVLTPQTTNQTIEQQDSPISSTSPYWILFALICLMSYMRLLVLDTGPLWWDETITHEAVTSLQQTGIPATSNYPYGYIRGLIYHFTVLLPTLFSGEPWLLRLPGAIAVYGIPPLVFLLLRQHVIAALFVAILLIFSPFDLDIAHYARFYGMHTLIAIVSLYTLWRGFGPNPVSLYRYLSLALFLIAFTTSELAFFLLAAFPAHWLSNTHTFREAIHTFWAGLTRDFRWILAFLIIVISYQLLLNSLDIAPQLLSSSDHTFMKYEQHWSFISTPSIDILQFYATTLISLPFILIGLWFTLRSRERAVRVISLFTLFSLLMYSVLHRDVLGARIYYLWEPFLFILIGYSLTQLFIKYQSSARTHLVIGSAILLIMTWGVRYGTWHTLAVGDRVIDDPFRSTHVADIRSDDQTIYQQLALELQPDDLWINVVQSGSGFVDRYPDVIFSQNYRWNSNAVHATNYQEFYTTSGSQLIGNLEQLQSYIQDHPEQTIYLTVRGGSIDPLQTIHLRGDFIQWLDQIQSQRIYISPDTKGAIYRFTPVSHSLSNL